MQTIGITGGTGFVGQHLKALLVRNGYKVIIFTTGSAQKPAENQVSYAHWDPQKGTIDTEALRELSGIVHLAGAGIADKRWTTERKKEILESRVTGTEFLVAQLKKHAKNCTTFIAASATGFYGPDRDGKPFTEDAQPYNDFLGDTCRQWEDASHKAESFLRTVILRFGIVLGKDHGAFAEFVKPMKFGIMPILGSGKQIVSWIAIHDLARLILFALEHEQFKGVYNAVTPNPVSQKELMKTIAAIKGGIAIPAPAPAFILKIMLGEMSGEILKSCTVSAEKTVASGFKIQYPNLEGSIKAILGNYNTHTIS